MPKSKEISTDEQEGENTEKEQDSQIETKHKTPSQMASEKKNFRIGWLVGFLWHKIQNGHTAPNKKQVKANS